MGGANDTVSCLSDYAQHQLENSLETYIKAGYLKVGKNFSSQRPGSSIAFLREVRINQSRWTRQFFCEAWTVPSGKYKVVNTTNGCYLENTQNSTAMSLLV